MAEWTCLNIGDLKIKSLFYEPSRLLTRTLITRGFIRSNSQDTPPLSQAVGEYYTALDHSAIEDIPLRRSFVELAHEKALVVRKFSCCIPKLGFRAARICTFGNISRE